MRILFLTFTLVNFAFGNILPVKEPETKTMAKPKVLLTSWDIPKIAEELLNETCEVIYNMEKPYPTREGVLKDIKGVDALFFIAHTIRLDTEMLDAAGPQLRVISTMSAGLDNVDIPAIKERKIKLGHTPRVLSDAVAEVAVLLTLATMRRYTEGRSAIKDGKWEFGVQWMLGTDIRGSTIGIVGLGGIGFSTAKKLKAFEPAKIIYSGHREKPYAKEIGAELVPFDNLVKESDAIIIAAPLTNETRGLFNEAVFAKMKNTSVLINVARGAIIDQDALVKALETNQIFGAGLDVMTPEPLPTDHKLLSLPNVVLMPHLGSATVKTRNDMAELAAKNILNGLNNKPMIAPVV